MSTGYSLGVFAVDCPVFTTIKKLNPAWLVACVRGSWQDWVATIAHRTSPGFKHTQPSAKDKHLTT